MNLSLAELETYGRVWGGGAEKRALCPFCDHPKRDQAHATLALNVGSGAWHCHRCGGSGLLTEYHTERINGRAESPTRRRRGRGTRTPKTPPIDATGDPRGAESIQKAIEAYSEAHKIMSPEGAPALSYLVSRGIPEEVAGLSMARFAPSWYGRGPAVLFPLHDAAGELVALEGRYLSPPPNAPKTQTMGPKSRGVYEAGPGDIAARALVVCEGPITALSVAAAGAPALALGGRKVRRWLADKLAQRARAVFLAFDWYETGARVWADAAATELQGVGIAVYLLDLTEGRPCDLNDHLQEVGVMAMWRALRAAFEGVGMADSTRIQP